MKQDLKRRSCPTLIPLSSAERLLIRHTVTSCTAANLSRCAHLGKERDDGHTEFKWKLLSPGPDRLQHLITQLNYRLGEGRGRCVYQIGVEDSGNPRGLPDDELIASIGTIFLMAKQTDS